MEYLKLGGEYRLKNGENVILIGTTHELSRDTQYSIVKPTVWCTVLRQYGKTMVGCKHVLRSEVLR